MLHEGCGVPFPSGHNIEIETQTSDSNILGLSPPSDNKDEESCRQPDVMEQIRELCKPFEHKPFEYVRQFQLPDTSDQPHSTSTSQDGTIVTDWAGICTLQCVETDGVNSCTGGDPIVKSNRFTVLQESDDIT